APRSRSTTSSTARRSERREMEPATRRAPSVGLGWGRGVTIRQNRMVVAIVSREDELARLSAFVEQAEQGPAALVVDGERGIGKSTLWLAAVERARGEGVRVQQSLPAEAERGLAYTGLSDLFEGVLDDVLPALSPPRRRALEIALLLDDASDDPVDPRAL